MKTVTSLSRPAALLLGLVAGVATAAGAHAESSDWPTQPITLLAPSAAGAPPDLYARALSEHLAQSLGQPVIVENVPAGGGLIAVQRLQRSNDGHTLLVNTAGMMTITPTANPLAEYTANDFAQICQGVEASLVLATHPSIPATNYEELAEWIRAQDPAPSYSSYSAGSPPHFLGYQLGETLGVDMLHVPYRSSPQQVTDMLGGMAPLGFVLVSTAGPHIESGKITPHAVTSPNPVPQFPDIPTVEDVGAPELTATVWFGLAAPEGTPPAILEKLTELHQELTRSPEFEKQMASAGLVPSLDTCGDEFLEKMNQETERWGEIVEATGFVAGN